MIRVLMELRSRYDTSVLNKKSAWLLGYFTFFWAFFLDFIESKPFSYRHFRLFQQALIIEEIDNGVHPSRADNLVKQIREIALERKLRVLITSHNPALLDAVPDSDIGNVLCCYRDPQAGDSRIVRLADLERFPELIVQGTLGQLMTKQVLDKFLKDKSTAEQRQQNALSWLEQLKQGEVA